MASTVKEKVKVSELSKFGFKVGEEYVNYSKHLPEADKTRVVPGAEFDAELFVADSGKRYLNKILSGVGTSVAAVSNQTLPPAVDVERAKKFTPKYQKKEETSSGLSKDEWAAKDRRISRQGCIQAAVQAVGPSLSEVDEIYARAVLLANKMLDFVNEAK